MNEKNTALIVVSGPSGCGKDTVIKKVCEQLGNVGVSVSFTSRKPRQNAKGEWEREGVDYFFIGQEEFEERVSRGEFVEYARDNKNDLYGTSHAYLEKLEREGSDVIILNIENNGAAQIRALYPNCISVFILPPSVQTVEDRLIKRGAETSEQIAKRIDKGIEQLKVAYAYDYIVLNDDLNTAVQDLTHIVCAARLRTMFHKKLIDRVNATVDEYRASKRT